MASQLHSYLTNIQVIIIYCVVYKLDKVLEWTQLKFINDKLYQKLSVFTASIMSKNSVGMARRILHRTISAHANAQIVCGAFSTTAAMKPGKIREVRTRTRHSLEIL